MVIAIEGLPGSGKTTLAPLVAARLGGTAITETTGDHPFLNQVYDDKNRDDLSVELAFLVVHANPYRRLERSAVVVCDYSPVKDELFAEDMLTGRDLELFKSVYDHVYEDFDVPDVTIFLRADPRLCLKRIVDRMRSDPSRAFEAGLSLERLERMNRRYLDAVAAGRLGRDVLAFDVRDHEDPAAAADRVAALIKAAASTERAI